MGSEVKTFIQLWFGKDLPEWIYQYIKNCNTLSEYGFQWKIFTDHPIDGNDNVRFFPMLISEFCTLVQTRLDRYPVFTPGSVKVNDYRPAFGHIFRDYLKFSTYWGHCDFDVVFGRLEKFIPDEELSKIDIFSNDPNRICGPFTLWRNVQYVNSLFVLDPNWKQVFSTNYFLNFDEIGISEVVNKEIKEKRLDVKYQYWQKHDRMKPEPKIKMVDRALYDGDKEIMMFHFPESKSYPLKELK